MRYVKTLGCVVIAVAALAACAGSASATTLTSPAGTVYTSTVTAEAGKTSLHPGSGSSFLTVSCTSSHMRTKVQTHSAGVTAGGPIEMLTFSGCTDTVTVLQVGSIEVHAAGGGNGTVTSTGAEIRIHTSEGPVCTFKTSGTDIGTLTGSNVTGGQATLDIGSSSIPATGFLCPSTGVWTGDYTVTEPSRLITDAPAPSTTLTSPSGTIYTSTITAQAGQIQIHGSGGSFPSLTCAGSHLKGKVAQHGTSRAQINIEELSFASCSKEVTVFHPGYLQIQAIGEGNGTVTWTNAEVRIDNLWGPACTFKTNNTHVGTITGSNNTGGTATWDIKASLLPSSGFLCPSSMVWTGDYTVATPSTLEVD
jgi:hypothetical protein